MTIYLTVPYEEKEQAKKLGARWDPIKKQWYVRDSYEMYPFLRWLPKRYPTKELYEKLNSTKLDQRSNACT